MNLDEALEQIAELPDFPEPGVVFRDLTPLFGHPKAFPVVIDALAEAVGEVDQLAAVEARGFVLAAAVAYAKGIGVTLVRKAGKLPTVAGSVDYALEYGTATLELPADAVHPGQRVAIVDDVLATGGTVAATRELLAEAGADVRSVAVVLELSALGGRDKLGDLPLHALRTV
ncbi:adenine phosphoribosyltransferase [Saccharomonospora sp. CUA-673]|uniref:adenine phosphoribosyltransferase n=1 Tax=Saccharomonospora sp. CUA-673 TaxID=1904969 RepID=UPI0009597A1F|nr:adenine phosphoribosyltransferase [Saccharomonospora sp. CUA-673]OLT42459.1 adenine phosphoribosyltransferase [Saccharomonospora sp. CUA-673]